MSPPSSPFAACRPSWQARLYAAMLRATVKPALERGTDIPRVRHVAERMDRWLGAPGSRAAIEAAPLPTCGAEWIRPEGVQAGRVVLYLPGGAFVIRTPRVHRGLAARIAREAQAHALLVFYRLAPEHPFPSGLEDALAAYERILAGGVAPQQVVLAGDSAGGNLVLSLLLRLRDLGRPLPAGAVLLSPATDLRLDLTGSRLSNAEADPLLSAEVGRIVRDAYSRGDDGLLASPALSPVTGDLRGLPPMLVQVGSTEILLDDARGVARRAREAGVTVELEEWQGLPHVWQAAPALPEARRAIARIADFIRRTVPAVSPAAIPIGYDKEHPSPMLGLMQEFPLLVSSLIRHADRHHGDVEIVSRRVEGDIHRCTYRQVHARSRRLANALRTLGVTEGDAAGTLAWNGYRHMELYFGVSGMGAVLHTINPRLAPDQVAWIASHAGDKVLFFDMTFLPIVEKAAGAFGTVKAFVAMTDRGRMPASTSIPNLLCYEDLLEAAPEDYEWPVFDENRASSICFTSGTTGSPKGVVYSHRSTLLHTFGAALPDALGVSARDVVLPVVPMFHVNAWGLPYACAMTGAKLVFPGPALDGKSLYELIETEKVTVSAGVPTVWQGLLMHTGINKLRFSTMRRTIVGGAALPPAMLRLFQDTYDVEARHAWGMTEMSPIGTVYAPRPGHSELDEEARVRVRSRQGRALYGVDMRIVDGEGRELPWDGVAFGDLQVRGPWILREYLKGDGGDPLVTDAHGLRWFPTGDVATIDAEGYMQITDRSKDVIKSGGEWISSIDIENIAVSHAGVAMAACIGIRHPKWDERPLLVVMPKPDATVTREEILALYEGRVAKWQVPDDVAFVEAIPLGATGKVQKNKLREQFRDRYAARA